MMDTGGPAFPNRGDNSDQWPYYDGMTLFDYYAGQALAGYRANPGYQNTSSIEIANRSLEDAKVMLEIRKKYLE